jgi:hypothetical protein
MKRTVAWCHKSSGFVTILKTNRGCADQVAFSRPDPFTRIFQNRRGIVTREVDPVGNERFTFSGPGFPV